VQIVADHTAGVIHYTLDGSEPNSRSPQYTGPLTLTASGMLQAAVWPADDPAARPSPMASASFARVEFGKGKGVYLSDLAADSAFAHGGLIADRNYRRNDFITLAGTVHRKGLVLCPEKQGEGSRSEAVYVLSPPLDKATRFVATVGIDDGGDERGSASFRVELLRNGTWETVFQSPVLRGRPNEEQREVSVELRGDTKLRLSTDGGSDISADHAAWGSARLE